MHDACTAGGRARRSAFAGSIIANEAIVGMRSACAVEQTGDDYLGSWAGSWERAGGGRRVSQGAA